MPNSLRKRVKKMAYKGEITSEEAEKIRVALDKQNHKKPIRFFLPLAGFQFNCPVCEHMVYKFWGYDNDYIPKYCSECGQKLDWSD